MMSSLGQPVFEEKALNVPGTNFALADWSQFDGKRISKQAMGAQLFSYTLYDFGGRNLDRVEVTAMMRMRFYGDNYPIKHALFNKFEDPESKLNIEYHNMDDASKQAWWTRIDFWFTELRRRNPVIQARADALRGLKGRLGHLEFNTGVRPPVVCGTKLEDYQLCLIHAINHWCGDREGKVMAFGYRVAIIILHYDFEAEEQTSNILSRLATENSELNASVARLAESRRYFFGRQALELQTKFEKERLDLPDRTATEMQDYENFLGLRPQSVTDTNSQNNNELRATQGIETMSIGAIISPSQQTGGKGKGKEKETETETAEEKETAKETAKEMEKGKGKGKGKGKEKETGSKRSANSSSPEGKGKGHAKKNKTYDPVRDG